MLTQSAPPSRRRHGGPGIDDDQADALHHAFARSRDRQLREQLARHYLPLAERLARRFAHRGESFDDLTQVARLGLVKAIDRFDPARGNRFSTFAVPTIIGELKRHFRDQRWALRVPRRIQETYLEVRQAKEDLTQELNRSPTVAEIAARLDVASEQVLEAMEAGGSFRSVALDLTEDPPRSAAAPPAAPDRGFEAAEARQVVAALMERLPDRERRILSLRFGQELTQSQIAAQIGVSQMQVSRLLRNSLDGLRQILDEDALTPLR